LDAPYGAIRAPVYTSRNPLTDYLFFASMFVCS
jgi:hypothetical protein